MNSFGWFESIYGALRHALRQLQRNPGFASVAILTLALGIGLNSAMFSVIHDVLLRALPYPEADRLVRLVRPDGGTSATVPEFQFWKENSRTLSVVAPVRGTSEGRLLSGREHQWITTLTVGADFLRTLQVRPASGREFNAAETHKGGPQAIILSDALWRGSFNADRTIVGRAVTIDQTSYIVVGILPRSFWFPESSDALVPLRPSGSLDDTGSNTDVLARLADGVTLGQARAEMALLTDQFRRTHGEGSQYRGLILLPYRDSLVGSVRQNLLLLFGATGLVLLISCANLTVLLITRFQARKKEFAVRLALGCSRPRLVVQHLIENLLLTTLGTLAGIALAFVLVRTLATGMPFHLVTVGQIRLSIPVLGFAIGLALSIALGFTLVPLLAARHLHVNDALKSAGRTNSGSVRARGRALLIVSEVALSTVLLVAAGLLIQSLYRLGHEHLGFDPHRVITFETPFAPERANHPADRNAYIRNMLSGLQAVPGVEAAAASNVIPLIGWGNLPTQREGHDEQSIGGMEVRSVTPAYFEAMRIAVRRGRVVSGRDTLVSPPVALINETLARAWYGDANPLGDKVIVGRSRGHEYLKDAPREIVGVVGDTKTILKETPWPTVFVPLSQSESLPTNELTWIVRARSSSASPGDLRRVAASIDPDQRIRHFQSMDEIVSSATADSRFNALLFALFGAGALVLAAVGVHGLISFLVAQRRQEIGARMALGATSNDILKLFLRQGIALTGLGLSIGLVGAYAAARAMAGLLFGVQVHDVFVFTAAPLVLFVTAIVAVLLPARRAAHCDPVVALRYE